MVLAARAEARLSLVRILSLSEDRREVEAMRLPVVDRGAYVQHFRVADRFVYRAEAKSREVFAHFLRDVLEEGDNELRLSREALAQLRVLRRDADRTRIEVAD